jgi:hypothetical protein
MISLLPIVTPIQYMIKKIIYYIIVKLIFNNCEIWNPNYYIAVLALI